MKKIWMVILLVVPFFINACSCDKFDINTYASAVRNYNNSVAIDYNLTITTRSSGSDNYELEESNYNYEFSTTKQVLNFASTLKKYKIIVSSSGTESAPQKEYELNRYYKSDVQKFYINRIAYVDNKRVENITYENKYDSTSPYHVNNLVPVFDADKITEFSITKDSANKGYSIATFKGACPTTIECDASTLVSYKVTINREFYFDKIEFTIVNEEKTIEYKYEFLNYNSDVTVNFPNDLDSY